MTKEPSFWLKSEQEEREEQEGSHYLPAMWRNHYLSWRTNGTKTQLWEPMQRAVHIDSDQLGKRVAPPCTLSIDISVGHFDWNGDINQVTVESDYLRSMLPHLMKGLFWSLGSHYMMLFHAQWYVLPLPQKGGGPLVFTQDKLLQLHQAQTTFQCGPTHRTSSSSTTNLGCLSTSTPGFPPRIFSTKCKWALCFHLTVSADYRPFLWVCHLQGSPRQIDSHVSVGIDFALPCVLNPAGRFPCDSSGDQTRGPQFSKQRHSFAPLIDCRRPSYTRI